MSNITRELKTVINNSAFSMNDPIKEMADFLGTEYRLDRSTFENQRDMLKGLIGYIDIKVDEQDFEYKRAEIYEDAKKDLETYWNCKYISCSSCTKMENLRSPINHYNVCTCKQAMMIDLLIRLENLLLEKYDAKA